MMANKIKLCVLLMLALALLISGCADSKPGVAPASSQNGMINPTNSSEAQTPAPANQASSHVTVYYATPDAMYLVAEKHTITKTDAPAKAAVELLFAEPADKQLARVLPAAAKLRNLTVKDHVAYADFSDKLIKNNGSGGSAAERLIVGAIVNTLTEFPEIHKVQILIEGKTVETLYGHMDVSQPLSRAEGIIKKK